MEQLRLQPAKVSNFRPINISRDSYLSMCMNLAQDILGDEAHSQTAIVSFAEALLYSGSGFLNYKIYKILVDVM